MGIRKSASVLFYPYLIYTCLFFTKNMFACHINISFLDSGHFDFTQILKNMQHRTGLHYFFQYCQPARNQPKSYFLFHKNVTLRDFYILTYNYLVIELQETSSLIPIMFLKFLKTNMTEFQKNMFLHYCLCDMLN